MARKMSPTGRVPKMGSRQDTVPHPASLRAGKAQANNQAVLPTSPIQKSGALGKGQDADAGSATTNVGGGGVSNGSFSRKMGKFNHDGAGAVGDVHGGTFAPLDVGGNAQQSGRAGGFKSV